MKMSYPGINSELAAWKGQEITDFQEELLNKVNGRLSEKWFYTHFKASNQTLPRIDVLNMLSKYAGYSNWDDFRFKNSLQIEVIERVRKTNKVFMIVPLIALFVIIVLFLLFKMINTQNYTFTFIDADTGEPILNKLIQVDLYLKDESPVNYSCDNQGSLEIRTDQSKIKFAVHSPYYLSDTIERILKKFNRNEKIKLHADAYALMIHYFSKTDIKGWQKRREQLDRMFCEDAMIYQVPDQHEETGIELYNKTEFIDKLTMPVSSLSQIEVLDTRYEKGRIAILKFKLK